MTYQEQLTPRFTLKERMATGFYTGLVAALSSSFFITTSLPSLYAWPLLTGYISGVTIIPWLIDPNKFQVVRSLAAGCLVTILTAVVIGIYFHQNISKAFVDTFLLEIMASIFMLMLVLMVISAPATLLFTYLLSKRRNKATHDIKPEAFN